MKKINIEAEKERLSLMYEIENGLKAKGYNLIGGIDEAGRGPLAGPVYAACVILPENCYIEGLNDSKKISPKKRDMLYDEIIDKAIAYSIASIDEKVIDEINILNATYMAMNKALEMMKIKPDYVLIDGNSIKNMKISHETVVKGDSKSASIAAASILAKVARDRYICDVAKQYPEYEFEKHKGYGTKLHIEHIKEYGPCPIHRKTFIKNFEV